MKLFGEYLVAKNVISEEQLLHALVTQVRELPSVPEILLSEKLMEPASLLKGMKHQMLTKADFRLACRSLGVWSEELDKKIAAHLDRCRTPLGELLVREGVMTNDQLIQILQDYLAERGPAPQAVVQSYSVSKELLNALSKSGALERVQAQIETMLSTPEPLRTPLAENLTSEFRRIHGAFRLAGQEIGQPPSWSGDCNDQIWKNFCREAKAFFESTATISKAA